jgi:nitroreductase
MDVYKAIETRRSVRKYKSGSMPDNELKRVLEAARLAPSAGNKQPWGFVVVRNQESKKKLAEVARNQLWIGEAGVVVVAFADPVQSPGGYSRWNERDVMTAVEHMVLAAWELGYGSCWVGAFEEEKVKTIVELPEDKKVICLLPIGTPAEFPSPKQRREFKEVFHTESYGKPMSL